jgi:hypothetical protein
MPSVAYSGCLVSLVAVFVAAIWPSSAESYRVDKYSLLMPNVQPKKVSERCIHTAINQHRIGLLIRIFLSNYTKDEINNIAVVYIIMI